MQEIKHLPIFVYGSLKSGKYNHPLYLEGKVKNKAKKSRIKAALYDIPYKGYPAIISNENNGWVYGEVYELINFEDTIVSLDKLESYYGHGACDNEYEREIRTVDIWNNACNKYEPLEVFAYIYCEMKDPQFFKLAKRIKEGSWPQKEI